MDPELRTELVLRVVETIPAGRVASYGTVAEVVGAGPRQVAAVMASWGGAVPWWRVTRVDGTLPPRLLPEARSHWEAEGIDVGPARDRCRIRRHGMTPAELRALMWPHGAPPHRD